MRNEFEFSEGINERLWGGGGGGERTFVMRVMRVVADGTDVQPRMAEKNPWNLSSERKSLHDFWLKKIRFEKKKFKKIQKF